MIINKTRWSSWVPPFWFSFRDHLLSILGSFSVLYRTRSKCCFWTNKTKWNKTKTEEKKERKEEVIFRVDGDGDRLFLKYAVSKISWFLWARLGRGLSKTTNFARTARFFVRFFAAPARPRMSLSKWIMHWPYSAKIGLADAWSVGNKLSIIETVDKMMIVEALHECLSRFPKTETLDTEQREESIRSYHLGRWRDGNLNSQSRRSTKVITYEERFGSKTAVLRRVDKVHNGLCENSE